MNRLRFFFELDKLGTTVRKEITAGLTTFVTMAYIIIVNPKILEAAGMPFGPSMAATILSAFFGTLLMGVYAKRPIAIAPYMGENAFIAFTVVRVMGYSWQTALGAIFLSGILFTLLTIFKVRSWLAESIPVSLKISFGVGIGMFLAFIGLNETGFVVIGAPGAPVHVGNMRQPSVLLAILGFVFMGWLMIRRVNGAILIGILSVTLLSFALRLAPLPERWLSMPPDISPIFLQLDIAGALTWGMFSVVLTVFIMAFLDTIGTLIALGSNADLLDSHGNLPEIEKPMMCDAIATTVASLIGTTTTGAYIESATGIAAGGKSGLTAVVTAVLFLFALFLAPFLTVVPSFAYGPALIIVGVLMIAPITRLHFEDLSESIPVFCVMTLMSFTYNIGIGMTAGFVLYPLFKLITGKVREIKPGLWVLAGLSLLFFVFYPY
ncbi:MAG: NCS2 family permease [Ignavibacteriae bacterium]|nr:MAG: NCS2 family permease [Ignavibacteriota bacterium]